MPNDLVSDDTTKSIFKRTCNQSQQATSSVTSSVLKKPLKYNEGQQNNDIISSTQLPNKLLFQPNETEIANQKNKKRNDDINNTVFKNKDTVSSASSSDYESDVNLVLLASLFYKNDDIIRPLLVSLLVRRNDSARVPQSQIESNTVYS
ncbi:hypothetical protein F8M41_005122 [Gigaspora margarita]|uniref:Uncharacterized protein n=1 Tax=Gigaspora margarita TaxID=4874 RepID=A0A8H3X8L6_GIGMA|nr:hypothetical protein F8M41_005122 [Gigaspora margarita]